MPLITNGSDLRGVRSVRDIKYIQQLRAMSRLIDGWVKDRTESKFYKYCIVLVLIFSFVAGTVYLRNKTGIATTFDLGHQYISVLMIAVGIIRGIFTITDKYSEFSMYFFNEVHLFNHKYMSSHAYRVHITVHKLCHLYTICITNIAVGAFVLFNLRPIINNFFAGAFNTSKLGNITLESSLLYALPFNYETNIISYITVSIFNCYISGACLSYFIMIDTLISIMVFHLWGHIKILTNHSANFPRPAPKEITGEFVDTTFTEEESKEIFRKLVDHIRHHNLIIDFLSKMSETFGGVLLVHYAFLQVTGCLMLLMCSPMDSESFARYGPLTVYCFQQLIQSSIIFELLDSSNDALNDATYNLPWECMSTKCRRIVYIMLMHSQRSIKLKAMDMVPVGVQTMITILKTSFSYFLMIKTFAEE